MSNDKTVIQIPGLESVWKREVAPRDDADQFVYIIAQLDGANELRGPCKVGISNNPSSRMASLQTGNAARLVLVAKYCFWRRSHALEVERVFHEALATQRTGGEWFDIEPDAAVALMAMNIRSFVRNRLQPVGTGDYLWAMYHIGMPGYEAGLDEASFVYNPK